MYLLSVKAVALDLSFSFFNENRLIFVVFFDKVFVSFYIVLGILICYR